MKRTDTLTASLDCQKLYDGTATGNWQIAPQHQKVRLSSQVVDMCVLPGLDLNTTEKELGKMKSWFDANVYIHFIIPKCFLS